MVNNDNFLIKQIPKFHPVLEKYARLEFFKSVKRCIFEGLWVGGRWCPPELYYHVNISTIQFLGGGRKVSGIGHPWFRDIEWEKAFIYSEACGFSGFINDPKYTCLRDVQASTPEDIYADFCVDNKGNRIEKNYTALFKAEGVLKKYMPAREYFYRTDMSSAFGKALYLNNAKNVIDFEGRGGGKSYWSASCIQHNLLTDGARDYDDYLMGRRDNSPISVSQTLVGAIEAKYSADLLSKVKFSLEHLPGEITVRIKGEDRMFASPLLPELAGSWESGAKNPIHDVMSGSSIVHRTFQDNPLAANGTRPTRAFIEECFAPGTMVRMADLTLRPIEDIKVGEFVLGADGKSKEVGRVVSGMDLMYKVEQKRGVNYIVNSKHLLYLEQRCKIDDIVDDGIKLIRAEDFELIGKYRMRTTYGKFSGLINLEHQKRNILRIDPYYLGAWLGDGFSNSQALVVNKSADIEIYNYAIEYYKKLGLKLTEWIPSSGEKSKCELVNITGIKKHGRTNVLRTALRHYNLINNKHIPESYLRGTEQQRLELLAGIIDTDGNFSTNPTHTTKSYEICVSRRKELAHQIAFLARCLGFDVHVGETTTNLGYDRKIIDTHIKYRISIKGEVWRIPCKVRRKQVQQWDKTNEINSTPIVVSCVGEGVYYGITLKANRPSDRLFLLEDNTVVHNCGFMHSIQEVLGAVEATQPNKQSNKYLPIYMLGTGGYTTTGTAMWLKQIFYDPESYDCLAFEDIWENKGKIGYFLPATRSQNDFKEGPNLISNEAKALNVINTAREIARKSNNKVKILTEIINQPITPSEVFMTLDGNFFPAEDLRGVLERLEASIQRVDQSYKFEMQLIDGRVVTKISDKPLIREFPIKKGINMDAPIEVWELPQRNLAGDVFPNRYIASWDPVDVDGNDDNTQSLQSIWVLDTWTDRIVAEYTARTYLASDYYEQARRLFIYYRAQCNYESNLKGPYTYFLNKNSLHLFCDTPESLSDKSLITISTIGNKSKGTRMSSALIKYGLEELLGYLEAQAYDKPEGHRNMEDIKSPALLRELIGYSPEINCDRISSLLLLMIMRADRSRITQLTHNKEVKSKTADPIWKRPFKRQSSWDDMM